MEELIKKALQLSCKIWDSNSKDVKEHKCRLKKTIMAKRMFIYYLRVYLDFKHKFKNDIKLYEPIKDTFAKFIRQMTSYSIYGVGYKEKKEQIEKLRKEILYFKK